MNLLSGINSLRCKIKLTPMVSDEFGTNRVHITSIEALEKGGGKYGMTILCHNADIAKVTLSLNASSYRTMLYDSMMATDNLINWYEQFGFKLVKPQNFLNFSQYMSKPMVRKLI